MVAVVVGVVVGVVVAVAVGVAVVVGVVVGVAVVVGVVVGVAVGVAVVTNDEAVTFLEKAMTQTVENGSLPAVAKRSYEPMKPIGSATALRSLLETKRDSFAASLPKHVTADRIIKTMLVAANRIPKLMECTQSSIIETISRAAELGLDLSGTLGEAYPVPFSNKMGNGWVTQCQLIIGYRGYAKLARQSGEIQRIEADVVCENDEFVMRKGSNSTCTFVPCLKGDRGKPVGAFAFVLFKDGGEQFEFMPVSDIERIRSISKSAYDKGGNPIGPWRDHWGEMAKKTVFKRLAKWLPLSSEKWQHAAEVDGDSIEHDVVEAETTQRGPAGIMARLAEKEAAKEPPPAETVNEATGEVVDASYTIDGHHVTGDPDPTPAAEPSPATPVVVPDDAGEDWLLELAVNHAPDAMDGDTATKPVKAYLKTKLTKPWAKLDPKARQAIAQLVVDGEFWK